MASHIRTILHIGHTKIVGSGVYAYLKNWHTIRGTKIPKDISIAPKWKQIQWLADHFTSKHKLQLFREPSRIKEEHSRYIQELKAVGLGRPRMRKPKIPKLKGLTYKVYDEVPITPIAVPAPPRKIEWGLDEEVAPVRKATDWAMLMAARQAPVRWPKRMGG